MRGTRALRGILTGALTKRPATTKILSRATNSSTIKAQEIENTTKDASGLELIAPMAVGVSKSVKRDGIEKQRKALKNIVASGSYFIPIGRAEEVTANGLVYCRGIVLGVEKDGTRVGTLILHYSGNSQKQKKSIEEELKNNSLNDNEKLKFLLAIGGVDDVLPGTISGAVMPGCTMGHMAEMSRNFLNEMQPSLGSEYTERQQAKWEDGCKGLWHRLKRASQIARNLKIRVDEDGRVEGFFYERGCENGRQL